jgi:L-alanine-DL-glutamate epimerase-like enolase superfamily enzyme
VEKLERLLPVLVDCKVQLVEQPFALGHDADLDRISCPIPIAADESIQGLEDLMAHGRRFDVVNIKLDKCGGLTEGLAMARAARQMGLVPMVGTMGGTSLGMAAGFVVGQLCEVVDLDGPVLLKTDRVPAARYDDGMIWCGDAVWGGAGGGAAGR